MSQLAETFVDLAERPRREVFEGNSGRMMALQHALAPGMTERMMRRMVDRNALPVRWSPASVRLLWRVR